ncbi:MAG TPA: hypothetical protein VF717_13855 [Pyrinomonadaceae bacterium]|jgi:hypothetical protein
MTTLDGWENFYVIAGAGALLGLQFVVMTLIAGVRHRRCGPATALRWYSKYLVLRTWFLSGDGSSMGISVIARLTPERKVGNEAARGRLQNNSFTIMMAYVT